MIFKVEYQMVNDKSNFRRTSWWKEVRDKSVLQARYGRSRLLTQRLNRIDREVQWMPRDCSPPEHQAECSTYDVYACVSDLCRSGLQVAARQSWISRVYRFDKRSMQSIERAIIEQSNEEVHGHLYMYDICVRKRCPLKNVNFFIRRLVYVVRKPGDCWK